MGPSNERRYLFVAGCPRSGTTALTRLLTRHPDVALSIERFNKLAEPGRFRLSPENFAPERFFHPTLDETHYDDFDAKHRQLANRLREHFGSARYIGDKNPKYYRVYDELFAAFDDVRIIYIYRNPFEVAGSYNGRVRKGENWPASHDYKASVDHWHDAHRATIDAAGKHPDRVLVVDYHSVFLDDVSLEPIWSWLEVDSEAVPAKAIAALRDNSKSMASERTIDLDDDQRGYVADHLDVGLYADVVKLNPFQAEIPPATASRLTVPPWKRRLRKIRRRLRR